MSIIVFDPAAFRAMFGEFKNVQCYPDALLDGWFTIASAYISVEDCACYMLAGPQRVLALNLLTAQMGKLYDMGLKGETPGVMRSASIDKVAVTVEPPPTNSAFEWWLSLTPYGQQLLALLQALTAGGVYIGGLPERDGFRRIGGGFGGIPPRFC